MIKTKYNLYKMIKIRNICCVSSQLFLIASIINYNYENYNTLSDIEADDENEGHDEDYFDYNKGARGAEALDLFNPMFNRGFYNNINKVHFCSMS